MRFQPNFLYRTPSFTPARLFHRTPVTFPRRRCGVIRAMLEVEENFVDEMKAVSMKLHKKPSKDKTPAFVKWEYTREGFLRHLTEARVVFQTFEEIINTNDKYALFRDSGLERSENLTNDIMMLSHTYELQVPVLDKDGPGHTYAHVLKQAAEQNEAQFLCHYYNYYLAHTAGGRMIGKQVADSVLDGAFDDLAFYSYETDIKGLVADFKNKVNVVASGWSRYEKDYCLEETPKAFEYAKKILRTLFA